MSSNPYRKDFPLLENNKVIYLDNAATSQRPEAVIQAEAQFYEKYNANPLRGLYELSVEATDCFFVAVCGFYTKLIKRPL